MSGWAAIGIGLDRRMQLKRYSDGATSPKICKSSGIEKGDNIGRLDEDRQGLRIRGKTEEMN